MIRWTGLALMIKCSAKGIGATLCRTLTGCETTQSLWPAPVENVPSPPTSPAMDWLEHGWWGWLKTWPCSGWPPSPITSRRVQSSWRSTAYQFKNPLDSSTQNQEIRPKFSKITASGRHKLWCQTKLDLVCLKWRIMLEPVIIFCCKICYFRP